MKLGEEQEKQVVQHHIGATKEDFEGNGKYGRIVLVSGSPDRSKRIAKMFTKITRVIENPRVLTIYLGYIDSEYGRIDLAAATSGMGVGSLSIVFHELLACGAKNFIRVGTSGTLNPRIGFRSMVITTAAVRDEKASWDLAPPEFPAICHRDIIAALIKAAEKLEMTTRTYLGITCSKSSLYEREGGEPCPNQEDNLRHKRKLTAYGVGNSEMEISQMAVKAQCRQATKSLYELSKDNSDEIRVGAVCVVVNDFPKEKSEDDKGEELFSQDHDLAKAEEEVCQLALQGAISLYSGFHTFLLK